MEAIELEPKVKSVKVIPILLESITEKMTLACLYFLLVTYIACGRKWLTLYLANGFLFYFPRTYGGRGLSIR
jgi:hypothetical protein